MSAGYDAIVAGAGINGLTAAGYLARARKRVLVLEAENHLEGMCETVSFGKGFEAPRIAHALYALDPKVVADLKLARHGLKFAVRDMPLVALRPDGKHLIFDRDARRAARAAAVQSRHDGEAWPGFRRELQTLARALRPLWWDAPHDGTLPEEIEQLRRSSVAAWLDAHFESDAVKAVLAWDAEGMPPAAPGSALPLVWRASQEMCGTQGAVAFPVGGLAAVIAALATSAKVLGVEIRTGARVTDFILNEQRAAGVTLESGEAIAAGRVLATFSRRKFLATNAGRAAIGIAEAAVLENALPQAASAKVLFALNSAPAFSGVTVPLQGRFVIAEKIETLSTAYAAASAHRLPDELTMEAVFPSAIDSSFAPVGQHVVSVLIRPLPRQVAGGWDAAKTQLAARAAAALDRFAPGLARKIVAAEVMTPDDIAERYGVDDEFGGTVSVERILSSWRQRIATPIDGLFLCGASTEPVGAVSGRAGRIAASMALGGEAKR